MISVPMIAGRMPGPSDRVRIGIDAVNHPVWVTAAQPRLTT